MTCYSMAVNVLYIDTRQQFQPTPAPPPPRLVFESIIQYLSQSPTVYLQLW